MKLNTTRNHVLHGGGWVGISETEIELLAPSPQAKLYVNRNDPFHYGDSVYSPAIAKMDHDNIRIDFNDS